MLTSWNRYPRVSHARIDDIEVRHTPLQAGDDTLLAFGNGRSYGDVCLNADATLLHTRRMDHFIAFDRATGQLVCESGTLLKDVLDLIVPHGWFLPVTPGTRYVTVGGAIANDVHGKNHPTQGSFGHHVLQLELLRSDGERLLCSASENASWFRASIGGLGLTGVIVWARLQLHRIDSAFIESESVRFGGLETFWELNAATGPDWPHSVAWIDCLASGARLGRGVFLRARHAGPPADGLSHWRERQWRFPVDLPFSLLNRFTLRVFNTLYYHRPLPASPQLGHYVPFFYPLDAIRDWNRLYGRQGFFQYQCVLPPEVQTDGLRDLLVCIARHKEGSFLAVLKTFGRHTPAGMLSFARPGVTLALDFPNRGNRTRKLFGELDAIVRAAGGALYPAKDARMSGELFRSSFPDWEPFSRFIDPRFSSSFWRRVMEPTCNVS